MIIGGYGVYFAYDTSAFDFGKADVRYINVARLVASVTEPNSVVITLQHSGSLRYYGGRTTLRYDLLHQRWLDRTILWLRDRGMRPYILLDDWEHEIFRDRFASQNVFGRLDAAKVAEYRSTNFTTLYDPLRPAIYSDDARIVRAIPRLDHSSACYGPAPFEFTWLR
jgi:hypothetical protein